MRENCGRVFLVVLGLVVLFGCATPAQQGRSGYSRSSLSKPPPKEAEALRSQAERAQKAGNISSAISSWERIVQLYPDTSLAAEGLYQVGHIYLEQGQPDRALKYLDYLLYAYEGWNGRNKAALEQLRALWLTGKKKEVMKKALVLWDDSNGEHEVQVALSLFMVEVYRSVAHTETVSDWLSAGFSVAATPEEKSSLTQATMAFLRDCDEPTVNKLMSRKPTTFMNVFLEYRLAQMELQKNPTDETRSRLRDLIARNPNHPIASDNQAVPRPVVVSGAKIPANSNRVGCLVPLNGPYRQYGQMVLRGVTAALEGWRKTHPDQEMVLGVRDAQADPEQAARSFDELASKEGALAIIGPLGAPSVKAVASIANKSNVPLLALAPKDEDAENYPFVLHIFLNERDLLHTLLRYCHEKLGYTRFATLYPDDRYGQRLSKIFADVVKEEGGSLLASIPYKGKSTDFKEPITKLMTVAKQNSQPTGVDATPFEALFIPDQVQTVALIAPQLPYNNVVGATLLGTNLWGESPLVQAGGAYVEQAIFATPFLAESRAPAVRDFKETFQAIYPSAPSYLEAQAYDAMKLFLEAWSASGASNTVDRASLLQHLLSIRDYQGVAGSYSFTPSGDLNRDYLLFQVLNGQLVQLTP